MNLILFTQLGHLWATNRTFFLNYANGQSVVLRTTQVP